MQSYRERIPHAERSQFDKDIELAITNGTLPVLAPFRQEVSLRSTQSLHGGIQTSLGVGAGSTFFAIAVVGLSVPASAIIGGLVGLLGVGMTINKYLQMRDDLETGNYDIHFTRQQYEDLLRLVKRMAQSGANLEGNGQFQDARDMLAEEDVPIPVNMEDLMDKYTIEVQARDVTNGDPQAGQLAIAGETGTEDGEGFDPSSAMQLLTKNLDREAMSGDMLKILKEFLLLNPMHLLIIAATGGGKGVFMSNMARFRAEADPRYLCFWIDPKNNPKETGYMNHPQIKAYRFNITQCSPIEVAEHMTRAITMFKELCSLAPSETPMQLFMDEWYLVQKVLEQGDKNSRAALKVLYGTIFSAISVMDSDYKHIVLVSQSPKIDDVLPGGGGIATNLATIGLFKGDTNGFKVLEKCCQCHVIPQEFNDLMTLKRLCSRSLVGRAIFFNNDLWPSPQLTIYASQNRDARTSTDVDPNITIENLADLDDGSTVSGAGKNKGISDGPYRGADALNDVLSQVFMDYQQGIDNDSERPDYLTRPTEESDSDVLPTQPMAESMTPISDIMPTIDLPDPGDTDEDDDAEAVESVVLIPIPEMELAIKNWGSAAQTDENRCLVDLLVFLKDEQQAEPLIYTGSTLGKSRWGQKWENEGILKNRKTTTIRPWLNALEKAKFARRVDNNRYEIIYR